MYSYVASYDYSQITAASDWPCLFCTLGVFVLHLNYGLNQLFIIMCIAMKTYYVNSDVTE